MVLFGKLCAALGEDKATLCGTTATGRKNRKMTKRLLGF